MSDFDCCPKLKHVSGSVVLINESPFSIGRGLNCNYVIPNSAISRQHCVITKENNSWTFSDTSTNGLFLNGCLIKGGTGVPLQDKDVIDLSLDGSYKYTFQSNSKDEISDEQLCMIADTVLNEVEIPGEICTATVPDNKNRDEPCSSRMVDQNIGDEAMESVPKDELPHKHDSPKLGNEQIEEMEDEMQCSICSEMFVKAVTLSCAHTFCKYCIETWRKTKDICPICRTKITTMNSTLVLDNVIEKVLQNSSDEVRQHRKELIEEREKLLQSAPKSADINRRGTRSRGRGRGGRGRGNRGRIDSAHPIPIIEVTSSDSDSDDSNFDTDSDDYRDYNSWYDVPYYGGYGFCYNCGGPDHWANGCPYR